MPTFAFRISPEQLPAFNAALDAAGLSDQEFVELAVRMLAARYRVEYPAMPPSPVKPLRVEAKPREGRPPRAAAGKHPMDYDVPAGDLLLVCPNCKRSFHSDTTMAVYCSELCKLAMRNRRQYLRRKKLK